MAETQLLPLFEFPTKVVVVDDNIELIEGLKLLAPHYDVELVPFQDPRAALKYLQEKDYCKFAKKYLTPKEDSEIFYSRINLYLNTVYQEVNDPARFDEISVLLIDYAMPGMNGQDFCAEVIELPIKKLLLTGEASYEKAVEMFNLGSIDRFIKKNDNYDELFAIIKEARHKYFQTITQELLFVLNNPNGTCVFSDQKFIAFFHKILKEHQIVEYYVADNQGSYLLLDKNAKAKLLIVKPEEEMQVMFEIAEGDDDADEAILDSLQRREKIAFLQTEEDLSIPTNKWDLYNAEQIEGSAEKYYYALVDIVPGKTDFKLDWNNILPYQQYLNSKRGK